MSPETSSNAARSANNALANTVHGNIRTASAIENMFDNFDRIPIEDLEKFASAYNPDQDLKTKKIFTREETTQLLEDILESPDVILDAINNEYTDHNAKSILEIFEQQK
jgi:hypothetical protein